jgi:hypothetical protein
MTIEDEIQSMYEKRYERREIKKPPSAATLYQHKNNIIKLHQAITANNPESFGQMKWIDGKSAIELLQIIKGLKGRKGDTLGIAAQRSYLSSILVAIRVIDFYKGQENPLFKDIMDLLQDPLKKEIEEYRDQLKVETAEKLPDYDEVMKLTRNYIDSEDDNNLNMKILLRIYTIYPIRLEAADLIYVKDFDDYRKLKKDKLTKNYVVVGKKKIIFSFSDYKTSDKYGTAEIIVKDKILKDLIRKKAEVSVNMNPMFNISRNTLSHNITEFFKKNGIDGVSPTTLAKVIETRAYNSIPESEREKMKTLAEFRRHSLDTQSKFYIH